ncbi:hypothetical protein [Cupriavidus necator]
MSGRREGSNPGAGAGRSGSVPLAAGRRRGQKALIVALPGLGLAAGLLGGSYWYMNGRLFAEPQWTVGHEGVGVPKFQALMGLNIQFPL